MPMRPAPACPTWPCPHRVPCPVHGRAQALAKEHRRPNRDVRRWYYHARWVHPDWGLRAQVLADDPWCIACQQRGVLTVATDIDHIVPHRGDPELFWDRGNLQGLCRGCHAAKTGRGA